MAKNTSQWLQEHWLFDRITTTLELICWKLVYIWPCFPISTNYIKALNRLYQADGLSLRILPSMILFGDISPLGSSPSGLLLQESNWLLLYAKLRWQAASAVSHKFDLLQITYILHIIKRSWQGYNAKWKVLDLPFNSKFGASGLNFWNQRVKNAPPVIEAHIFPMA